MSRHNSKEAILDAAETIVVESGAAHLTLDAVAERSNLSKGGVMYNYPSKEALLDAMFGRLRERHEQSRQQARQERPPDQPNELWVEIKMLLGMGKGGADTRLNAALLAVIANQPELPKPFCEEHRERFNREVVPPEDFDRSAILFFAALGLHLHELLKFQILTDEQRERIQDRLLELAASGAAL
jgi:AcrR family transcriptional regulator